jgi:potassium channel LctB
VSLLRDLGYTAVDHYHGGMQEWLDQGLPLERAGETKIEKSEPRAAETVTSSQTALDASDRGHLLIELFERRSMGDLVTLWFATIGGCALLYWLIATTSFGNLREGGSVLGGGTRGLLTSLYFSFVTATSLGFGDVVPVGLLRGLAIVEAVLGLLVFGAVVSKLVSRRQERIISQIHLIAFEDRLKRVQTDLHFVLMELLEIAQQCKTRNADMEQLRTRLDSVSALCLGELRTIHDLLYRPQSQPEEGMLEGILATLAMVLRALRELLRCISFDKSAYLAKNLKGVSRYAEDICSDCVPRRYAAHLREWMDAIKETAPDLI